MTDDEPAVLAVLEAALMRCEAQGVALSPRCIVVLALLMLHGLPMTARRLCELADDGAAAAMSPGAAGRVLRQLWRAGLIVRLDRRHGYVARPPRPGRLVCEAPPVSQPHPAGG